MVEAVVSPSGEDEQTYMSSNVLSSKRPDTGSTTSDKKTLISSIPSTDGQSSHIQLGTQLNEILNQKKMNLMKSPIVIETLRISSQTKQSNHHYDNSH
ncbi:hypothetical protein BLOT_000388 [Blomia tropicalis]|nr:hypothetical protein BLOT_000388 [Blomia tropicalis]